MEEPGRYGEEVVRTATEHPNHDLKTFVLCGRVAKPPLLLLPLTQENVLNTQPATLTFTGQSKRAGRGSYALCLNS